MLFDAVPFSSVESVSPHFASKALRALLDLIERVLGVQVVYDTRQLPLERPELTETYAIARKLHAAGILQSVAPTYAFPDEPPTKMWHVKDTAGHTAGGTSSQSDSAALTAALAESLERYLWHMETDYFDSPVRATTAEISRRGSSIAPDRFAGFSDEQRSARPEIRLLDESKYLWIKARSLVHGRPVYVPAQVISGVHKLRRYGSETEPLIRMPITTGLATWPTREGARLAGALEVIEREAYMIMWLNQLVLPRIPLSFLRARGKSLSELIALCERYRLRVHVVRLLTDAPAHAVCAILEDLSDSAPRFTVGIRAHGSLDHAVEKAIHEALRARTGYRRYFANGGTWADDTSPHDVGHYDRIYYWGVAANASKLEFLTRGEEQGVPAAAWENDTPAQHLERIVAWCRASGFECASVSLGTSNKNPTSWSVEMVTIPELQPLYLSEKDQETGGSRWKSVPEAFGIAPRSAPFTEEPHPFA